MKLSAWGSSRRPPHRQTRPLAELRQANAHHADGYNQRLAAGIVAMLPAPREEALRVLAYVYAILNLSAGAQTID
jgi:hypothetical protein